MIDARHAGFPAGEFLDSLHLNDRGARHISATVADVLRRTLDSASWDAAWIDLPATSTVAESPKSAAKR